MFRILFCSPRIAPQNRGEPNHETPTTTVPYKPRHHALRVRRDDDELIVYRSTAVDDDGSIMWEVREHIREHDLVAGDRVTKKSADWMFGEVEITWYMSQAKRRDGLASHKGPHTLQWMLDRANQETLIDDVPNLRAQAFWSEDRGIPIVQRSRLSDDDDRSWQQVQEYVHRHGMVLLDERDPQTTQRIRHNVDDPAHVRHPWVSVRSLRNRVMTLGMRCRVAAAGALRWSF